MTPLEVTQVAHDDAHAVRVQLSDVTWRMLLGDVARHVTRAPGGYALLLAAGRGRGLQRTDAIGALVRRLDMEPHSIQLTPDEASVLSLDLSDAAAEPDTCRTCDAFVDRPSDLSDQCGRCTDRADLRLVSSL